MQFTIKEIQQVINAQLTGPDTHIVDWLLTDSRSLSFPETTLFFAIQTAKNDGHLYIPLLYQRGVRSFVVQYLPEKQDMYPEASFLLVDDSLRALQQVAEATRRSFRVPVIGITGSNGKTIVKEWLNQLLSADWKITRSPRSYNSQVGVPLSVWLMDTDTQLGIFEAGISQKQEMQRLQPIIRPTLGILTNIGPAHQENFSSLEEKCLEKLQLFSVCQKLVYNADSDLIDRCIQKAGIRQEQLFPWSRRDNSCPLYISKIEKADNHTVMTYSYEGVESQFTLPFISDASVENSLHCLATCLYLGLTPEKIAQRMPQLEAVAMRMEVKEGRDGCLLINDSYNSDVNSLYIALDFMNRRPDPEGRKHTLILSDMLQTGQSPDQLYAAVAHLLANRGVDKLLAVGPELCAHRHLFTMPAYFFRTTGELMASREFQELHDEFILLKGARDFRFEKVSEQLELKVHETILEINLNALVDNVNYYRRFMKPETKMVCMVKASGYGIGSLEVSKTLQDSGVDYLAVAVADEGADLRKAGITSNILIMNPEMTAFQTMFDYKLEPEVYNFSILEALIKAAEREGMTNFPIHIKLDTGMHRLGFDPLNDMPRLISRLKQQNALIVRSVFSHFVGSDSPDFDAFSALQFQRFQEGSSQLQEAFPHKILRHICNTAGIQRFPERHLDMVRLGLGLYGVNPIDNQYIHHVATLKTTILQIRDVAQGDSIGYSRKSYTRRPSRIAAIPIGYADGLNRHLGNGRGYCLVNGHKAPYIGNICMDVCMIDVTDIPCREGDKVVIFGAELPVCVLSDWLDTIPYEILTGISSRVKKVYYKD
ncbi:MAG: bifunctional UDP-N-acetylmuramoyl-tripeptide:D-alanyl-D-alanine ligase/alanine racemase [Bacteroidaceae bacterium]|nr:bifunctional UDP-N-acetylmuramoyl-tripeptide:D-alanyl-D-alanine ligase/alanine racemase [Bacteroidaceae bacterium]